jgi:hypothetical protein
MSGAAAAASAASKFQSFMNHPVGALPSHHARPLTRQPTDLLCFLRYRNYNRSQDRLLLGPSHEVGPSRRRAEGSQPTGRETLCIAEYRYAHFLFDALLRRLLIKTLPATALAATGCIWVRYALVITPVNYSLAAVSVTCLQSVPTRLSCAVS